MYQNTLDGVILFSIPVCLQVRKPRSNMPMNLEIPLLDEHIYKGSGIIHVEWLLSGG